LKDIFIINLTEKIKETISLNILTRLLKTNKFTVHGQLKNWR